MVVLRNVIIAAVVAAAVVPAMGQTSERERLRRDRDTSAYRRGASESFEAGTADRLARLSASERVESPRVITAQPLQGGVAGVPRATVVRSASASREPMRVAQTWRPVNGEASADAAKQAVYVTEMPLDQPENASVRVVQNPTIYPQESQASAEGAFDARQYSAVEQANAEPALSRYDDGGRGEAQLASHYRGGGGSRSRTSVSVGYSDGYYGGGSSVAVRYSSGYGYGSRHGYYGRGHGWGPRYYGGYSYYLPAYYRPVYYRSCRPVYYAPPCYNSGFSVFFSTRF